MQLDLLTLGHGITDMVCKIERPSPQALFDKTLGLFSANVLGGYDVIPESVEWYVVANDYALQEELYSITQAQLKARDPAYMCCDDLYEYAARFGVYPNPAGFAQGYVRIKGNVGANIPSAISITIEGNTYVVTGSYPSEIPDAGYVDVRVKAIVPGSGGNVSINKGSGRLVGTIAGIDSTVTVLSTTFCGGSDEEKCEAFRERFLSSQRYSVSENVQWIMDKLASWPCVTRVYQRSGSCCEDADAAGCCGCNKCAPVLGFYVLLDNTFDCGIPSECVVNDINDWLFGNPSGKGLGEAPIGICGKVHMPKASVINVTIDGVQCATQSQITKIRNRIKAAFLTAQPSELFTVRRIELTIAQVLGGDVSFDVVFEDTTGNMTFTPCGDLDPECDIMPCLGKVIIVNETETTTNCK